MILLSPRPVTLALMPRQNRIDPYGRLHATSARGAWMGNRGVLHNAAQEIVADWRVIRWITCRLSFKGIRRKIFSPNRYTELFFLDEATSLAAGHRPCAECRRDRYKEFCAAWFESGPLGRHRSRADEIDRNLHAERVRRDGTKKTYLAAVSTLPPGTFIELEGRPYLLWRDELRLWTFLGYGSAARVSPTARVRVLTPRSIVRTFRAGFVPQVHESEAARAR
jgi:hypothetical protein